MRTQHGLYIDAATGKKARLYHIWEDMKNRCYNPKNKRYAMYGGRGISVCEEWRNSYGAFHTWANQNGYASTLTIDRENVHGNYEPGNCKWATQKQQGNNRTNNRILTYGEVSKTVAEWAEDRKIAYHVIKNRIERGWSIERALDTPTEIHTKRATQSH